MRSVFNCDTSIFYVPIPENQALDHLRDIDVKTGSGRNDTALNVYMGITASSDAIVIYDHWEDGFESNPRNPTQSSTLIWGDGDISNGITPGTDDDILGAGTTSVLQNQMRNASTTGPESLQNVIDYDGRDKIYMHGLGAVSKLVWGTAQTLSVSGAAVPAIKYWGTNYILPVGENTPNAGDMLEVTNASIMALRNGTTISIDEDRNSGTAPITATLNEGESYYLDSRTGSSSTPPTTSLLTVNEGATISSNFPVQVMYMTGNQGTSTGSGGYSPNSELYGGRTFPLIPNSQLDSVYVVPAVYGLSRRVYLYNPNGFSITITRTGPTGSPTNFTIPANSSANQAFTGANEAGYKYASTVNFAMMAFVDDNGNTSDWGFVPTSKANLQQTMLMSIGFGQDPTSGTFGQNNYEQLLVTPVQSTYFYADFNGDKLPDKFSINSDIDVTDAAVTIDGVNYNETTSDNGVLVGAFRTLSLGAPNGNMSGAQIWTKTAANNAGSYGSFFSAIWGQNDGSVAASPNLDAGYNIPPKIDTPINVALRVRFPQVCPGSVTDTIHINIIGGTAPYRIQWINLATGIRDAYAFTADSAKIPSITPGTYLIKVRDNNCFAYQTTVNITQKTTGCGLQLTGTVYNDGNGLQDALVNGTGMGSITVPSTTQLYAYLDSAGKAIRKYTIPNTGNYAFSNLKTSYSGYAAVISATSVTLGASTPSTAGLPGNWESVGENYGTNNGAGSGNESGTPNSRIAVNTGTTNISGVNFGLDRRPESVNLAMPAQINPGPGNYVTVGTLNGSDLEDGTKGSGNTMVITTLPTNGTLRYNGTAVSLNQVITSYNPALLQVTPSFSGAGVVSFEYAWRDNAGLDDLSPATVTVPFTDLKISGTVYHDPNGLVNGVIDGDPIGVVNSNSLVVYLVNNGTGLVIDSVFVNPVNGTYQLENASANTQHSVRVSATKVAIGSAPPSGYNVSGNWVPTGEQYGNNNSASTGIESGSPNGLIAVTTGTSNVTLVDFGLEVAPIAHDKLYTIDPDSITAVTGLPWWSFTRWLRLNASSGNSDTVENNTIAGVMPGRVSGIDPEDGRYLGLSGTDTSNIVITQLPDTTNAMLVYGIGAQQVFLKPNPIPSDPSYSYWDAVNSRYEIVQFNPNQLFLYFKMAAQVTTSFRYAYRDSAAILGTFATYTLSYTMPLPVELIGFNCQYNGKAVQIKWTTLSELNMKEFIIERAVNSGSFVPVASVKAAGISYTPRSYEFTDADVLSPGYYAYRLKMTETDGGMEYSDICGSQVSAENGKVNTVSVFPNPAASSTQVELNLSEDQNVTIELSNLLGQVIWKSELNASAGISQVSVDLSRVGPGAYLIKVNGTWVHSNTWINKQ